MLRSVHKPKSLIIYELLRSRMMFSTENKKNYRNLLSGYEGERLFSHYIKEKLHVDSIVFYDVLFDYDGSVTQIDCFILLAQKILIVEIKNFYGEFRLQNDQIISLLTNQLYQNPLHQLKRAEINFRQHLKKANITTPILTYVVFVNKNFTLFTEKNNQIILPSQIDSFFYHLNNENSLLSTKQLEIANKIMSLHSFKNPMERLPVYEYDTLKKGITCHHCGSWMARRKRQFYCHYCQRKESFHSAIVRSALAFHLLFPHKNITIQSIWEWTAQIVSKKTINRILHQYLSKNKAKRNIIYFIPERNGN